MAAAPVLDVDGDGELVALSDGLLALRWLFGLRGQALISGAVDGDCTRCTAPEIEAHLQQHDEDLDVDGDGESEALTDGLLIQRWLFGFRGIALVNGAVDLLECTRCEAAEIETYIEGLS
jgi:hypothetical protein